MNPERPDPYQLVTDLILQHLERGVVPWRCPWNRSTGCPRNFHTGQAYQGVNVLLLGLQRFASPWWMTFRQAQARGGSIRKGEHGARVIKWGKHQRAAKNASEPDEKKTVFYLKGYRVFNATQIDGLEFPTMEESEPMSSEERLTRAKEIVADMPVPPLIHTGRSTQACYRPPTDTIDMPAFERFTERDDYYATLFHELVHATGHQSRLARRGVMVSDGLGGKVYSQEELVAEMGAAFLGMEADIVRDEHELSASYLKSWLGALRDADHRRWIVQAASQAARAADFILGRVGDGLTRPDTAAGLPPIVV
jgi:antirestriction protein ArdC